MMSKKLIVYGVSCTWWDNIEKAKGNNPFPPCCPYCRSLLMQMSEKEWFKQVDEYEKDGHPGYRKFVEWLKGKCFKNYDEAKKAYKDDQRNR